MPVFALGQIISEVDPKNITGSNDRLLSQLKISSLESVRTTNALLFESPIVDIRDVAAQHIASLQIPEAGGKRFISNAGNVTLQHICECSNTIQFGLAPHRLSHVRT
jgi:hypothetical protein